MPFARSIWSEWLRWFTRLPDSAPRRTSNDCWASSCPSKRRDLQPLWRRPHKPGHFRFIFWSAATRRRFCIRFPNLPITPPTWRAGIGSWPAGHPERHPRIYGWIHLLECGDSSPLLHSLPESSDHTSYLASTDWIKAGRTSRATSSDLRVDRVISSTLPSLTFLPTVTRNGTPMRSASLNFT